MHFALSFKLLFWH